MIYRFTSFAHIQTLYACKLFMHLHIQIIRRNNIQIQVLSHLLKSKMHSSYLNKTENGCTILY